jgi:hypothetical protein
LESNDIRHLQFPWTPVFTGVTTFCETAESPAYDYLRPLVSEGRQDEVPRSIIASDFARIALHDLEPEEQQHPSFCHCDRSAAI